MALGKESKRESGEARKRARNLYSISAGTVLFYPVSPHTLRGTCTASQAIFYIINAALPTAKRSVVPGV